MLLWGLFLVLGGAAFIVRPRGRRFEAAVLLLFALCTAALGCIVFYGCYASAPYSMGLGAPGLSAASLTSFTCLGQGAFSKATGWTVIALSCSAALGSIAWGRSHSESVALRAALYVGAALLLVFAGAVGFGSFFVFSWCSSSRLF